MHPALWAIQQGPEVASLNTMMKIPDLTKLDFAEMDKAKD